MTVEAMSSLPFQAGSAVAAAAGRTALWAVSVYMRQPLRNTALAALIGLSAMAGSNALYKQAHHHPAPLFGSFGPAAPAASSGKSPAVIPAERPKKLAQPASVETTGSVSEPAAAESIKTDDIIAMQHKLVALGLLEGKADGLFGPRTAKAIRAYETSVGRTPRGLLTPTIVAMIRDAQLPNPAVPAAGKTEPLPQAIVPKAAASAAVTAQAAPAASAPAPTVTAPAASSAAASPLPAPAPLLASTSTNPAPASQLQVAALDAPALTQAAPASTTNVVKRSVQTIAVRAAPADSRPAPAQTQTAAAETQAASAETKTASAETKTAAIEAPAASGDLAPITEGVDASTDHDVVAAVQRGLNSLGFLHQQVDGIASEATAKAIRNFEVYYRYDVTGRVTRELVRLLKQNGAVI